MTFGDDICICDNLSSDSYSSCGHSYGKNEGITDEYYLTGNTEADDKYFTPVEVEVYQVTKL